MYLVTWCARLDDLPVSIHKTREEALAEADRLWSLDDDGLYSVLDNLQLLTGRDTSSLLHFAVWEFNDQGILEGPILCTGDGSYEYEF